MIEAFISWFAFLPQVFSTDVEYDSVLSPQVSSTDAEYDSIPSLQVSSTDVCADSFVSLCAFLRKGILWSRDICKWELWWSGLAIGLQTSPNQNTG